MKAQRQAFTLLEVVLVLVIIVMLAGLAIPSIDAMYADVRLKAGADHLRARFAEGRTHAIEEGRPYRFAIKPGETGYKLAPDSSTYWGDSLNVDNLTDDQSATATVVEDNMPSGITFGLAAGGASGSGDSSGYIPVLTFNPDGSCDDDRTIRLELGSVARPLDISVRALTGAVTVRSVPGGSR